MTKPRTYFKHLEPEILGRSLGRFAKDKLTGLLTGGSAGGQGRCGQVISFSAKADFAAIAAELKERDLIADHQLRAPEGPGFVETRGKFGPVWLINLDFSGSPDSEQPFGPARDLAGLVFGTVARTAGLETVYIHTAYLTSPELIAGLLVGLECGSYSFKRPNWRTTYLLEDTAPADVVATACRQGQGINLARHLVNLPANLLNPESYEQTVRQVFGRFPAMAIDVLKGEELAERQFNLLSAVGQGAEHGPRLIHLKYRPGGSSHGEKPYAFVGKGITFDNGGVNIKSFAGMRHMKKDMGGSAAVCGLAYWCAATGFDHDCDFYLAIAENAISAESYRPGDIITSFNGLDVEIHNTDAEGRLVMADTLAYAATLSPEFIIDVSTLTGAIKVALGTEIAGLFSNRPKLAAQIAAAGESCQDLAWPMPLHQRYRSLLDSHVADMVNAASSKFGGAITAALFLEQFVDGTPWAHLDIMAWADGGQGCMREAGGNGQGVALLITFLTERLSYAAATAKKGS